MVRNLKNNSERKNGDLQKKFVRGIRFAAAQWWTLYILWRNAVAAYRTEQKYGLEWSS